jgi:hypothetical protein
MFGALHDTMQQVAASTKFHTDQEPMISREDSSVFD